MIRRTIRVAFLFSQFEYIAARIRDLTAFEYGDFSIDRYRNGELHVSVKGAISGNACSILGSIAPPEEQFVSFTLLAHTLIKEGAARITGILPYLAYTREDKPKPGAGLSAAWAGSLLRASGVDSIMTVDLHSERDKQLFSMPLLSVSPAMLFAATIGDSNWNDATIVAPDNGAVARCEAVKATLGIPPGDTPYFEKHRTPEGIVHGKFVGEVGPKAILVDDILDTRDTLVSACQLLDQMGVLEICIFVTHGLFTATNWRRLWSLGVERIFCTDTIPACARLDDRGVTVLPVANLLAVSVQASR